MARTTETAVREILNTTLSSQQVVAFIEDASLWITEEVASATPTQGAARLEVIERWLACALCRVRSLGLKSSTIKDVSETYQVDADVTDYLNNAAAMDATGKIRQNFLAPKLIAEPARVKYPIKARIGKGFAEDTPE